MDDEKVKGANILDILPKLKKLRPIDDMFFRLLSGRIYISEYDVLKTGKPLTVKRNMVKNKNGMDCRINNGETIYFATSKVVDDTKISRLLQRMIDTDSFWDSEFSALSEAVNFFKCTKEGNLIMCKLAEELKESGRIEGRQEGQLETIVTLIKNGMISLEQAVEQFGIGEQELKVYLKK